MSRQTECFSKTRQCLSFKSLAKTPGYNYCLANIDQLELLLASPLTRALQTCEITFASSIARGLKIIALPMAEEASDAPADTGSEKELLQVAFPHSVDFGKYAPLT